MIFEHPTPESLLSRSDSKNPATTCKGITNKGQPCRKALSASITSSYGRYHDPEGVLAVLDAGHAAAFFCHHHEHQAESLVSKLRSRSEILPLKKRGSIDTLVERLGVLHFDESQPNEHGNNARLVGDHRRPVAQRKSELPREWQSLAGPLMVVPEEILVSKESRTKRTTTPRPRATTYHAQRMPRSNVKASWSCCIRADDDDEDEPPPAIRRRHEPRKTQPHNQKPLMATHHEKASLSPAHPTTPVKRKPVSATSPQRQSDERHSNQVASPSMVTPTRPQLMPRHSSTSPPNSQTLTFLSYIPPHLSPSATSALLSELSRPISNADEDGYIYIFWLTPDSDTSKPDDETASSLLDTDDSPAASPFAKGSRRPSAVSRKQLVDNRASSALQRYASVKRTPQEPEKILLKIGRAVNVHRRLTQWTKQCGQNITLIRCYPYTTRHNSPSDLEGRAGYERRTVPHVHRVERLIHLELANKRADKDECESCGRVHREWFEVEATKQGVREVDEVIRRWVSWAEARQ